MKNRALYEICEMDSRCTYARVTVNGVVIRRCGHDRYNVNDAIRQMLETPMLPIQGMVKPDHNDVYRVVIDIFTRGSKVPNCDEKDSGHYRRKYVRRIEFILEGDGQSIRELRLYVPIHKAPILLPSDLRDDECLMSYRSMYFHMSACEIRAFPKQFKHFRYSDEMADHLKFNKNHDKPKLPPFHE